MPIVLTCKHMFPSLFALEVFVESFSIHHLEAHDRKEEFLTTYSCLSLPWNC